MKTKLFLIGLVLVTLVCGIVLATQATSIVEDGYWVDVPALQQNVWIGSDKPDYSINANKELAYVSECYKKGVNN